MGGGDGGAMSRCPRCARHATDGDDSGRAGREHVRGNILRFGERKCISSIELGRDRVSVCDGARIWIGAGGIHGAGTDRADGMRGDGVGVGDVVAVQYSTGACRKSKYLGDAGLDGSINEYRVQFRSCTFIFSASDGYGVEPVDGGKPVCDVDGLDAG